MRARVCMGGGQKNSPEGDGLWRGKKTIGAEGWGEEAPMPGNLGWQTRFVQPRQGANCKDMSQACGKTALQLACE
jgi:hypothetical protein